ncbi:MAG TPA: mannose-6-phosphate isomerase, class I [Desertimonas sp.]|nr:mannose-6-phosphate isomerase, class I [Desertimonas sp.]
MQPITGAVQHYPWGDERFIPELFGRQPDGTPWAELWLGTHPSGMSRLPDGRDLSVLTGTLPYLLKVLAAAQPLSLQTHPTAEQAQAGYQAGRYPDPYPKPELLCALTDFEAFCGVRPIDETIAVLEEVGLHRFAAAFETTGVAATIAALLRGKVDVGPIIEACAGSSRPEARWVIRLADLYPGDPSIGLTLLLNYIQLEPGEAIQLAPGNLHCYLGGAGVELMGASDNVVRAGLTTKSVDVDTVLEVMDPTPLLDPVMSAARVYPLADTSIRLLRLVGPAERLAKTDELVIVVPGRVGYLAPGDRLGIAPGEMAFVATA